ncbi:hypothetical protein ACXR2T_02855 [Leucobacter sp. HY1910]
MPKISRVTRPVRLILPAALAAAALMLTACSGADSNKTEPGQGPLSKYTNALWDGEEITQEQLDKQNIEEQDLIAACMAKEGFEYTPDTNNGGTVYSPDEEPEGPEWGTEEFAKQYGYGIIDSPWMGSEETMSEEEWVDPNADYVNSLSESEQTAYYEALSGPSPTEEEMAAMEDEDYQYEYNWETSGCYGAAQHELQQDTDPYQAASEDPQFADMFKAMEEMWNTLYDEQNPNEDIAKLNRTWADCMAEAGQNEFTSPNAAQQTLYDELNAMSMIGDDGEYKEPSKEENKKFQEREIEVALADTKCKKKSNYDDAQMKIMFDAEQKFVDEHTATLEAMVAQYGVKSKKD